ncbi:MAG: rhodanese-like domain-containing protein, partial [Chloroflexota bacterium]|nr:rhodanese-like domain-containing protein [Chloroflexota bacterium]
MAGYAQDVLLDTDWLAQHAKDSNVRVFEIDVDTTAYEQGHVDGAIGLNWKTDLQQHPVRDLLDKKQLETLLSKCGVTPATTIVAYGDNNNWFAAWFFWLLKYYGHKDVKLVNGGRAKWVAEKRPLSSEAPSYAKSEYRAGTPDASIRALRDHVLDKVVSGNGTKIVDVRSPKEYAGELLA